MKGQKAYALEDGNGYLLPVEEFKAISYGSNELVDYDKAANYRDSLQEYLAMGVSGAIYMFQIIPGGLYGFGDGTVSLPAVTWAAETNTGRYRIGTNNPGESVSGTLKWDWDASRIKLATTYKIYMGTSSNIYGGAGGTDDYLNCLDSVNSGVRLTFKNSSTGGSAYSALSCMSDENNALSIGIINSGYNQVNIHAAGEGFVVMSDGGGLASQQRGMLIGNRRNSYVRFIANDTEWVRLLAGGAFLYGATTQAASEKFRVVGTARFDNNVGIATNPDATTVLSVSGNDCYRAVVSTTEGFWSVFGNPSFVSSFAVNRRPSDGTFVDTARCSANINLFYSTTSSDVSIYTGSTPNSTPSVTMTITGGKNLGVGTVDKVARRRVESLDAANPQYRATHTDNSAYTDFQTIASGNCEVTPSGGTLEVKHGSAATFAITATGAGSANLNFQTASTLRWNNYVPSGSTDLRWKNGVTDYMTLDTSGNFYLSTLTTGSIVFVAASGKLTQDNANLFWDDSNNYLGLGTATPGSILHVLGGDITVQRAASTDTAFDCFVTGDARNRLTVRTSGEMLWSDGTNAADVDIYRSAAGVMRMDTSVDGVSKFLLTNSSTGTLGYGGFSVTNSSGQAVTLVCLGTGATGYSGVGLAANEGCVTTDSGLAGLVLENSTASGYIRFSKHTTDVGRFHTDDNLQFVSSIKIGWCSSGSSSSGSPDILIGRGAASVLYGYNGATAHWRLSAVAGSENVLNDQAADLDTRIKGDTDAATFFVDASADSVGVGTSGPLGKFHVFADTPVVYIEANSTTAATLRYRSNGSNRWDVGVPAASANMRWNDQTADRMTLTSGGGLQIGVPTGGDKGVGTINVSSNIYLNDSAYANPDYALEHWATGRIERFKDNPGADKYQGRMALADLKAYCLKHFRLPGISDEPMGVVERFDFLLEKVEEIFTHLFEMDERIGG